MAAKKFAISVSEDVMREVDRAARARGLTRSRFIADTLRVVASARTDAELSRRINRVFSDPDLTREQLETADQYGRVRPGTGTEW